MINIYEKIIKGIKKINKEEKNKIKILTYISKINENKNDINNLLNQSIKSFKFSYLKENNHIKYEKFNLNFKFVLKKNRKRNL